MTIPPAVPEVEGRLDQAAAERRIRSPGLLLALLVLVACLGAAHLPTAVRWPHNHLGWSPWIQDLLGLEWNRNTGARTTASFSISPSTELEQSEQEQLEALRQALLAAAFHIPEQGSPGSKGSDGFPPLFGDALWAGVGELRRIKEEGLARGRPVVVSNFLHPMAADALRHEIRSLFRTGRNWTTRSVGNWFTCSV